MADQITNFLIDENTFECIDETARQGIEDLKVDATTTAHGLMSAADKTKLDGIQDGATKYTLPIASASALGGIKVGTNLSIDANGILNILQTETNFTEKVQNLGTVTTNQTLNANDYSCFTLTLGANISITPSLTNNGAKIITIIISGGSSHTITWASSIKWADASAPQLTGLDMVTLICTDKTNWYGVSAVGLA